MYRALHRIPKGAVYDFVLFEHALTDKRWRDDYRAEMLTIVALDVHFCAIETLKDHCF